MFRTSIAAAAITLCLVSRAETGCRHVVVQKQAAVIYQPVQQQYFWAVGQSVQEDAAAQRIANKVMALLAAQPQQLTAPQCPDGTCPTPQTLPLTAEPELYPNSARCVSCHNGTNVKATEMLDLSDIANIDCETKLRMIGSAVSGRMPKGKPFTAQELGDFIGGLVGEKVEK